MRASATLVPPPLQLVGAEVRVPCADGSDRRYVHLDNAASTPALEAVRAAVDELLPWYSSVHRGAGYKSQVATAALEGARQAVLDFVDARDDDVAVFVRNTTEAINVLSATFAPDARILGSPFEHHANMLPWRRQRVELLPFTPSPEELVAEAGAAFERAEGEIELLAISAASNVTGETLPVGELTALAHEHRAQVLLDAAQYVSHRPLSVRELDVDFVALSGHKLYAPYGAGALVGRREQLEAAEPLVRGGGAIKLVTLDGVVWADVPDRCEAGSPNLVGAVALGVACDALRAVGMERVAASERALARHLWKALRGVPGLSMLRLWGEEATDAVGVASFILDPYDARLLATVLGVEHALGVRSGRFCAHPLMNRLLGIAEDEVERIRRAVVAREGPRLPGAVRASLGVGNNEADVDLLVTALKQIVRDGPEVEYELDPEAGRYRPAGGGPGWPEVPFRLAAG